jgi:hypothetical protein
VENAQGGSSGQEVRHHKNGQLAAHCQRISDISSCFRQNEPLLLTLITKKLLCVQFIPFVSAFPLAEVNVFHCQNKSTESNFRLKLFMPAVTEGAAS